MSEINTNMVLDGITLAIRLAYPGSHIESDSLEQGLETPAFILLLVSGEQIAQVGSRYKRPSRFDVLYFPTKGREECCAVADELRSVLELITLPSGDMLRGTGMSFEITDGVLHFFVSYNHFVCRKADETMMEKIKLEQGGN
ncbi:MAG: hypothetical protein IJY93_01265, partial [Clostridia bacterium]|nr:hypothetical protein [Clostridia bacterium]